MANWPSILPDAQIESFNQFQTGQISDQQDADAKEQAQAEEEDRQRRQQLAAMQEEESLFSRTATAEPQTPDERMQAIQTTQPVPPERRPGPGRFSPFDDTFRKYMGDQAQNPELLSIIAAATRAESGWNPQASGDQGRSIGLFQMHEAGAGSGMSRDARMDPDTASAKMVPKFVDAYNQVKAANPNLSGAELASLVAARAERPQGWDDPTSTARNRYRQSFVEVMNGTGAQMRYDPVGSMDDPRAGEPILTNNLLNWNDITGRPMSLGDYNQQRIADIQQRQIAGPAGQQDVSNPLLKAIHVLTQDDSSQGGAPAPVDSQGAAPSQPSGAGPSSRVEVPNQFGDPALSSDEAMAACGPAAYVAFARATGRNPSLREAVDLAKQYGWDTRKGMAGAASEVRMLNDQGIPAELGGLDPDRIDQELAAGRPVSVSTPAHYFVLTGKNPDGTYYVGTSGTAFKAGAESMTLDQMQRIGGQANGVIYLSGGGQSPDQSAPQAAPPPGGFGLADGKSLAGQPTGYQLTSNRTPYMIDDAGAGISNQVAGTPDVQPSSGPTFDSVLNGAAGAVGAGASMLGKSMHDTLGLPDTGSNPPSPLDVGGALLNTPTKFVSDQLNNVPGVTGFNNLARQGIQDIPGPVLGATMLGSPVAGSLLGAMRLHDRGPIDMATDLTAMGVTPEARAMRAAPEALSAARGLLDQLPSAGAGVPAGGWDLTHLNDPVVGPAFQDAMGFRRQLEAEARRDPLAFVSNYMTVPEDAGPRRLLSEANNIIEERVGAYVRGMKDPYGLPRPVTEAIPGDMAPKPPSIWDQQAQASDARLADEAARRGTQAQQMQDARDEATLRLAAIERDIERQGLDKADPEILSRAAEVEARRAGQALPGSATGSGGLAQSVNGGGFLDRMSELQQQLRADPTSLIPSSVMEDLSQRYAGNIPPTALQRAANEQVGRLLNDAADPGADAVRQQNIAQRLLGAPSKAWNDLPDEVSNLVQRLNRGAGTAQDVADGDDLLKQFKAMRNPDYVAGDPASPSYWTQVPGLRRSVNAASDVVGPAGTTSVGDFATSANTLPGLMPTNLTGTQAMNAPQLPAHLQAVQQQLTQAKAPLLNDDQAFGPVVNSWEQLPNRPFGDMLKSLVDDKRMGFERTWLDKFADLNKLGPLVEQTVALLKGVMGPGVSKALDERVAPIVRTLGGDRAATQYFNEMTQLDMDMDVARRFGDEPRFYASMGPGGPEGKLADLQALYADLQQRAGPDMWSGLQTLGKERQGVINDLQDRLVQAGVRDEDKAALYEYLYPHFNPTRPVEDSALRSGANIASGGRDLGYNVDNARRLTPGGSPTEKIPPLEAFVKAMAEGEYLIAQSRAGQNVGVGLLANTSFSGTSRLSAGAQKVMDAIYSGKAAQDTAQDFFDVMRKDPKDTMASGAAQKIADIVYGQSVSPQAAKNLAGIFRSEALAAERVETPVHMMTEQTVRTGPQVSNLVDPLVDSTVKAPLAKIAEPLFGKDPSRMRIPVRGDGFFLSLPPDPHIRAEIQGLGPEVMNAWMQAASALNRPLRAGATTLDPRFTIDNPIADMIGLVMRRGLGVLKSYPEAAQRAVNQVFRGGDDFVNSLEDLGAAGGPGKYQGMDAHQMVQEMQGLGMNVLQNPREAVPALLRAYGANVAGGVAGGFGAAKVTPEDDPNRALKIAGGAALGGLFGKPMEKINEAGEVMGRTAAALDAQRAGATLGQSALEYRRGTVDFGRMGTAVQFLAPLTVFASAQFGGAAAPFRAIGDATNKPMVFLRDSLLGAAAAGLYGYNRLFPEYKDIPEWMKQNYQIVMLPGSQKNDNGLGYKQINALAIPTREYTLYTYPVTKALEHLDGQDPENFGTEMGKFLMGWSPGLASADSGVTGAASAFMPAPLKAFAELQTGKSFYTGKDIEGARVKALPRTERADDRTSAFATSDAGGAIANNPLVGALAGHQLSPVETDFLLKDILGGTGRNIESLSNAFAGKEPQPGYTPGASDVLGGLWRTYGGEVQGQAYEKSGQYYQQHIDQTVAAVKADPRFQKANPDEQVRILTAVDRALRTEAQEQAGVPEPRQKDQPWKYAGVQDVQREQQIDRLISKYDAWLRNGRKGASGLTQPELQAAVNYKVRVSPQYTKWARQSRQDAYTVRQGALS